MGDNAVIVLHPDRYEVLDLGAPSRAFMRTTIGCDLVSYKELTSRLDLVHDEAQQADIPENPLATAFAHLFGWRHVTLRGLVVVAVHTAPGATTGLGDAQRTAVVSMLDDLVRTITT